MKPAHEQCDQYMAEGQYCSGYQKLQDDLAAARARVAELEDALLRKGFVQCDIPACNCGSWHHRYGLPERWEEIKECLADAGHPLCNENGHVALHALQTLVSQRNALHERAERAEADLAAVRALLKRQPPSDCRPCHECGAIWWSDEHGCWFVGGQRERTALAGKDAP